MTYVPQDVLYAIQLSDPDGGDVEPTAQMYALFESYVVAAYGRDVWDVYRRGGWAQDQSEGDWSHLNPDSDS